MHIPVGFHAAATVKQRGSFSCASCKHWQRAEIVGIGGGGASLLGGGDLAHERARTGAARNAARMLRFASCPRCKKRSGLGAFAGRYALLFATLTALMFVLGFVFPVLDHSIGDDEGAIFHMWGPLAISGLIAVIMLPLAVSEWRHVDRRVRWLDF